MSTQEEHPWRSLSATLERGDIFAAQCPSRPVLQHLTSRWGVIVLAALLGRPSRRFSELRRMIGGISEKMLAQTLQNLERDGFVNRTMHPVLPPHVDYSLTKLGRESACLVTQLADFVENRIEEVTENQRRYDSSKGEPWNLAK